MDEDDIFNDSFPISDTELDAIIDNADTINRVEKAKMDEAMDIVDADASVDKDVTGNLNKSVFCCKPDLCTESCSACSSLLSWRERQRRSSKVRFSMNYCNAQ